MCFYSLCLSSQAWAPSTEAKIKNTYTVPCGGIHQTKCIIPSVQSWCIVVLWELILWTSNYKRYKLDQNFERLKTRYRCLGVVCCRQSMGMNVSHVEFTCVIGRWLVCVISSSRAISSKPSHSFTCYMTIWCKGWDSKERLVFRETTRLQRDYLMSRLSYSPLVTLIGPKVP